MKITIEVKTNKDIDHEYFIDWLNDKIDQRSYSDWKRDDERWIDVEASITSVDGQNKY
jgi:hypothetical protein